MVVGKAVFGAPDSVHLFVENDVFSRVLAKNRGPKTAVPTPTHPIPHLTPADWKSPPQTKP